MIFTKTSNLGLVVAVNLIVGTFLLITLASAREYPSRPVRTPRGKGRGQSLHPRQLYDFHGRRLRITPKECQSSSPRHSKLSGVCMFNLECQEASGTVIGACVDRFLFGACCHIPDEAKRKAILGQGTSTTNSNSLTEKENKNVPQFSPASKSPVIPGGNVAATPPIPPLAHPATRFPSRVSSPPEKHSPLRRVPAVALHNDDSSSISIRKHSTVPPPIDTPTLLPLTLETFSSVSDPFTDGNHGGDGPLRGSDGKPLDSVERETLGLSFTVTRDKPRPSSTRVTSSISSSSTNSLLRTASSNPMSTSTQEPPKISTFMYVDEKIEDKETNTNVVKKKGVVVSTKPEEMAEEKTVPGEELQSNTENIWSVVMQLGSQDEVLNLGKPVVPARPKNPVRVDTVSSLIAGLVSEELKTEKNKQDVDNNNDAEEIGSTEKYPPLRFFGDMADPETEDDTDSIGTTEREETTKPWASSTYYVHTFKYPNFTAGEDPSDEETFDIVPVSSSAPSTTTAKIVPSTSPSIGKITTWSGIGTVVNKEDLGVLGDKVVTHSMSSTTPTAIPSSTTTTKYYTTRKTTERPITTQEAKKTTPSTTEKWKKPQPYTLPPHKRPTTTHADTSEEDDADEVETKEEELTTRAPSHKRPPQKPEVIKHPVKKETENENMKPPSLSSSIILDEDMDTNLDDFVEQVVQGLAGSLDNLNIDNVILNGNDNDHDSMDPLQIISDPSFPPFPIMGETPLTKPNVKLGSQESISKNKVKLDTTTTPKTTTTTTTTTQKPLDWRKDCGVRTPVKSGRIVGGTASKFGRWPWQALVKEATWLGLFSKNKCGGVLIAPKYVLTAAHCQPGFLATLTVVLGEFDISSASEGNANAVTKNVRRVIVHRDYNAQTFENDIALLELDSAVDFQSHIVPVCLPNDEEEFIGKKAFVTGWGRLKYGGGVPQILHEVDVPILKNDECQDMFHKSNHLKAIRDSFICAGYAEGFKDSCEGDSGGPLSIQRDTGQWVLAGTVSHGIKCAYPNLPGVYMRMTYYKPWIKRVTGVK